MKKNELFSAISTVTELSVTIGNADSRTIDDKKTAREMADAVINHYIAGDDLPGLCQHLTDTFGALRSAGLFGHNSPNNKKLVPANMQRAQRFFARSLEAIGNGITLRGYNPFTVAEVAVKAKKSSTEKLQEIILEMGGDRALINKTLADIATLNEQAEKRQGVLAGQAIALSKGRDAAKLTSLIAGLRNLSIPAGEIAALIKAA